ncbi:MAG: hydrogenase iron-sulfur subunit [Candidatus Thorarchaeota archaeon]
MTEKTAVILCTCGRTLQLDYERLQTELGTLETTASVTVCDTLCQESGLDKLKETIQSTNGRIVIAACSSQKIHPRIRNYLANNNMDASMIHYVNIREHCAWVHEDQDDATEKALAMIRGMTALSSRAQPLKIESKEIKNHVTVIGGGIAGIEASLNLAGLGYEVTLIELTDHLGGHILHLPVIAPTEMSGKELLSGKLAALEKEKKISVMLNTRVKFVEGEMGAFKVHYIPDDQEEEKILTTSGIILAMGFKEFKPTMMDEYQYGKNPDVITQFELSKMLTEDRLVRPSNGEPIREVVMIQCVGSRSEEFKRDCSKLCCTFAIDNALELVKQNPDIRVRIIYMDIRVPFEHEIIYKESRERGIDYIRGRVSMVWREGDATKVRFYDSLLNQYFETTPDLVVLSAAVLPPDGVYELSESLGFAVEYDGHIKELYGKLRRNETRRRGVIAVGAVTRPQFVHESIIEAQAGSLAIHNELQGGKIEALARGAVLNIDDCIGCSLCAQQCPRGVPLMVEQTEIENETGTEKFLFKASIDTLNCHACGVCQSLCPSGATQLNFLTNEQLWSQIAATLEGAGPEKPITLCFHCEECAVSTIDIVGTRRMKYPSSTRLIPVPCAGRISIIDILKAFEHGASTVMIAACETDRCHMGGTGNEIAQVQVDVAREILNAIGWRGERVDMFRMFSAEPERFTHAVEEMVKRAHEFGPTPVHTGTAGKWMEVAE